MQDSDMFVQPPDWFDYMHWYLQQTTQSYIDIQNPEIFKIMCKMDIVPHFKNMTHDQAITSIEEILLDVMCSNIVVQYYDWN